MVWAAVLGCDRYQSSVDLARDALLSPSDFQLGCLVAKGASLVKSAFIELLSLCFSTSYP